MTDQEKKELTNSIRLIEEVLIHKDIFLHEYNPEIKNVLKEAKKLLEAAENLPTGKNPKQDSYGNTLCYPSIDALFDEGFNLCLDQCTAIVAAHYVAKKDLPSAVEEKPLVPVYENKTHGITTYRSYELGWNACRAAILKGINT